MPSSEAQKTDDSSLSWLNQLTRLSVTAADAFATRLCTVCGNVLTPLSSYKVRFTSTLSSSVSSLTACPVSVHSALGGHLACMHSRIPYWLSSKS